MSKRKKIIRGIIIVAVVVILFAIVGGIAMFRHYVSIRGQHLNSYSCSSGGGMTGGYNTERVTRNGDHALIRIESAEWHSQEPTVTEYLADPAVLDELEAVVRKFHMNFWNRKKFTNVFVADGESQGYHFKFDENDISFSSQIYPARYANKLAELRRIVEKYIKTAEKVEKSDEGDQE